MTNTLAVPGADLVYDVRGPLPPADGRPVLSQASWAITDYRPDAAVLTAAPTRIVVGVGEESAGTYTARTALGLAALLGQEATVFPSHHGGFLGGEFGYAGKPVEFAAKLREVLDQP